MKKIGLIITIVFITTLFSTHAQIPVAFKTIRTFPTDTIRWNILQNMFSSKEFSSAKDFAYSFADSCYNNNNTEEFLFIINQTAANYILLAQDINTAESFLSYGEKKAHENSDTLNIEYAMLMKFIATTHYYKYEDNEALKYYLKGLKTCQHLDERTILETDLLMNTGNSYVNTGKFVEALPYLDKALNTAIKENIPTVFMLTSQSFGYIAGTHDINLAINFYQKIEQVAKGINIEKNHYNKYMANICNALASLYSKNGDQALTSEYEQKAYNYLEQTNVNDMYLHLSIYGKLLESRMKGESLNSQNSIKNTIIKYIDDNGLAEKTMSIPVYTNIMYFYNSNNMNDSVDIMKKKIEKIISSTNAKGSEISFYKRNLAKIAKDEKEKEKCLLETIQIFLPEFSTSNSIVEYTEMKNIDHGNFFNLLLPTFKDLIKLYNTDDNSFDDERHKNASIKILKSLLNNIEKTSNAVIEKNTGKRYSSEFESVGNILLDLLYDRYEQTGDKHYIDEIINTDSRIKAFFLSHQMDQKMAFLNSKDDLKKKYINLLMKKNDTELQLQEALLSEKNSEQYKDSILNISFELIKLQLKMKNDTAFWGSVNYNEDISKTNNLLDKDEAIISYYIADSVLFSSIITKKNKQIFKQYLPDNFNNLIKQLKREIKSGAKIQASTNNDIFNIILNSFSSTLKNINHIIIIPHKNLTGIPFELICDKNGEKLINNYDISYQLSHSLWIKSKEKKKKGITNIKVFAPVFKQKEKSVKNISDRDLSALAFSRIYNANRTTLSDLSYSKKEALHISSISKKHNIKAQLFIEELATESNFKKYCKEADIIHIATHSYVNKKYPYLTGLFFAENRPEDDGFLFVDEILNLTINPYLIVLSSCKSGSGVLEGSEGVNSLQRYFIQAGTPNVIASLWKVHDKKTKELMEYFYRYLLNDKVSYSEALRLAKLKCIKNGFLPIDWAPFIIIGE